MSFQPVVPIGGLAGWGFLNRTLERQSESFTQSAALQRDTENFRQKIAAVTSAEQLVGDRALLRVALGAFGLQDDLDNRFFIRTVLEEGSRDPEALANRMADKRYLAFAEAFGFGEGEALRTGRPSFADDIVTRFETRSFEIAVGETNGDFRLALNARRELAELAARDASPDTLWFSVMGSAPLRTVFETTFGLPSSFAALDLDRQLEVMRDRTAGAFGSGEISQFTDPEKTEELVRLFLLRSELQSGPSAGTPGMAALSLLQGTRANAASILSALY